MIISRIDELTARAIRWVSGMRENSFCTAFGMGTSILGTTQIGVRW